MPVVEADVKERGGVHRETSGKGDVKSFSEAEKPTQDRKEFENEDGYIFALLSARGRSWRIFSVCKKYPSSLTLGFEDGFDGIGVWPGGWGKSFEVGSIGTGLRTAAPT